MTTTTQTSTTYHVVGNTYPHRASLKVAGLRWDADRRAWTGSAEQVEEFRGVVGLEVRSAAEATRSLTDADDYRAYNTPRPSRREQAEDAYLMRKVGWR